MKEGKKNNDKHTWQEFLKYLTRQFTNHEMHHFERKVDKSAFDTEALEGLEQFAGASMDNDIELLKDHIHKRNTLFDPKPKQSFPIKSIAAVAIIVIASGILISMLLNKSNTEKQQLAEGMVTVQSDSLKQKKEALQKDTIHQLAENLSTKKSEKETSRSSGEDKSPIKGGKAQMLKNESDDDISFTNNNRTEDQIDKTSTELEIVEIASDEDKTNELILMDTDATIDEGNLAMADSPNSKSVQTTSTLEVMELKSAAPVNLNLVTQKQTNKIQPEQGDSAFKQELKLWLKDQEIDNEGQIQLKINFNGGKKANSVTILQGIEVEANKAIQFYIMNKTLWLDKDRNAVNEGEFVYSFTL